MRLYLETSGVEETTTMAVTTASTYLKGDAWSWWRALCERAGGRAAVANWEEFSAAIKDRFQVVDEGRKARIALTFLRQTTTVRAYTQEFQRLMLLAPETHELDRVVLFTLGLRGAVREEVDRGQPTTILQAMRLADRADNHHSNNDNGYEEAADNDYEEAADNDYEEAADMELGAMSGGVLRAMAAGPTRPGARAGGASRRGRRPAWSDHLAPGN